VISSTSSCGHPPCRVEAQRRPNPPRDRTRDARERVRVALLERSAGGAAGDVHGTPHTTSDDERGAQLVGDVGRQEQVAVAGAALRGAAGGVVEDPDRDPPPGQVGEGVEVLDHVLASQQQFPGGLRLLGPEHTPLDQLVRRVAGHQTRVRIQRVPAAGVVVHDLPQPR
jgi:hypothetical protein